jgi:hypothetical protein
VVEMLSVPLAQLFHEGHARFGRRRREQQMHVIGHQAVRVDHAAMPRGQFAQVKQIKQVIALAAKAGSTVVSALGEVHGDIGKDDPQ